MLKKQTLIKNRFLSRFILYIAPADKKRNKAVVSRIITPVHPHSKTMFFIAFKASKLQSNIIFKDKKTLPLTKESIKLDNVPFPSEKYLEQILLAIQK